MNHQTIKQGMLAALMLLFVEVSVKGQIPSADATAEESTTLLPYYLLSQQDDNGQLGPPLPFNPYPNVSVTPLDNGRGYAVDDLDVAVAKALLSVMAMSSSEPPGLPPEGQADTNYYNGTNYHYNVYGSNGIWLEIQLNPDNPGFVTPILHNATNNFWELFVKRNLNSPIGIANWTPTQVLPGDPSTNAIYFNDIQMTTDQLYFRAVGGNTTVRMDRDRYFHDPVEPCTTNDSPTLGYFTVSVDQAPTQDLTVRYTISGSASNVSVTRGISIR